ncbi:MAG: glycosyltransferase family 2 protein [Candidatus Zixiibacteriota bacterium]
MSPLSVVIISKNEERNIARCLASVSWADEIILIDSQSQDETVNIAQQYKAKVYSPEWKGYGAAKKEGVKRASSDWILSIDADEEVSPQLRDEIREVLSSDGAGSGYYLKRKTLFLGRWIKHCGWYPDYVLRLFRKSRGDFDGAFVHEKVVVEGEIGHLNNELLHYSYPTLEEYFRKFDWYTSLGARETVRKGTSAGWFDIVVKPPLAFVSRYVLRQGFRDGLEGFLISVLSALAVMVKYAKAREIYRKKETVE